MATAALKPCARSGCRALVRRSQRFCPEHQLEHSRQDIARRGNSYERGYCDRKWLALRDFHADAHEHCAVCGSWLPRESRIVDHVQPHRGNEQLRLDPRNLQTLCRSCHAKKTAREGVGYRARLQ